MNAVAFFNGSTVRITVVMCSQALSGHRFLGSFNGSTVRLPWLCLGLLCETAPSPETTSISQLSKNAAPERLGQYPQGNHNIALAGLLQ